MNDLKDPETNMGDGERFVVADIFTTRLLGVTFESRLTQHQDPEDEENRQPDLSSSGGVGLNLVQKTTQCTPITHSSGE
uniref:Uncharacterized protein n=1 Tax=Xiphophorus couchianus TaxID=32473 RepID=A0A3B5LF12_9TELE